ncbi:Aste57867_22056 [Aphanomyces stellatus]|uniref:Aste57867_22056 protein n=1 Tax=Aphanomyces stellatus TaxID=120398 RepID=A0A485LJ70_9STRA|nr:hypothetical protein As57867_021987 [Aphanomyces stellatus]VFT98724.1 Aste57867_22056 [Aphanomyces stellatus]
MAPHQHPPPPPAYDCPALLASDHALDGDLFAGIDGAFFMQNATDKATDVLALLDDADCEQSALVHKKGEKRKQQIREASRRCRMKQKDEVAYLRMRVTEMEQVIRDQASAAPTTVTVTSADAALEIAALRRQNQHLAQALDRTKKQLTFIQTLMLETIQTSAGIPIDLPPPAAAAPLRHGPAVDATEMARIAAASAAILLHFVAEKGLQVVTINTMDWVGDVWLDGTTLRFAMSKFVRGKRDEMACRLWKTSALPRAANDVYTLVSQECVAEVSESLRVMRRVESLMEMRLLEQYSLFYRHVVDPTTVLVGMQSIGRSSGETKYTHGMEHQGILLTQTDDDVTGVHVHLRGTYDCVGVPESEVATRFSKDTLNVLLKVEETLVGA